MASNSVYRVTDLVGTSKVSWEDAVKNAVQTAGKTLRELRVGEVSKARRDHREGQGHVLSSSGERVVQVHEIEPGGAGCLRRGVS